MSLEAVSSPGRSQNVWSTVALSREHPHVADDPQSHDLVDGHVRREERTVDADRRVMFDARHFSLWSAVRCRALPPSEEVRVHARSLHPARVRQRVVCYGGACGRDYERSALA